MNCCRGNQSNIMKIMSCDSSIIRPVIEMIPDTAPLDATEFERQLRAGGHSYHIYHPFNVLLNSGRASQTQVRAWVANRFYYEANIPVHDAAILANCDDREVRREWVLRILAQDGYGNDPGGLESWVRLGEAVGLPATELWSMQHVLSAVRVGVDDYVGFARRQPWQEAVCASLTDLFAPSVHRDRLASWPVHYPWIENSGFEYFRSRVCPLAYDAQYGLRLTLEWFRTRAQQQHALDILRYKLDLLWSMLDALQLRYGIGES
jgi:pyrroloquinoline-quinone synthase